MDSPMNIEPTQFALQAQLSGNSRLSALNAFKELGAGIKESFVKVQEAPLDEGTKAEIKDFAQQQNNFLSEIQKQQDKMALGLPMYAARVHIVEMNADRQLIPKKCTIVAVPPEHNRDIIPTKVLDIDDHVIEGAFDVKKLALASGSIIDRVILSVTNHKIVKQWDPVLVQGNTPDEVGLQFGLAEEVEESKQRNYSWPDAKLILVLEVMPLTQADLQPGGRATPVDTHPLDAAGGKVVDTIAANEIPATTTGEWQTPATKQAIKDYASEVEKYWNKAITNVTPNAEERAIYDASKETIQKYVDQKPDVDVAHLLPALVKIELLIDQLGGIEKQLDQYKTIQLLKSKFPGNYEKIKEEHLASKEQTEIIELDAAKLPRLDEELKKVSENLGADLKDVKSLAEYKPKAEQVDDFLKLQALVRLKATKQIDTNQFISEVSEKGNAKVILHEIKKEFGK